MSEYYAVISGRAKGLFYSWKDCKEQVSSYKGAIFKKFRTEGDACSYLRRNAIPIGRKRKRKRSKERGNKLATDLATSLPSYDDGNSIRRMRRKRRKTTRRKTLSSNIVPNKICSTSLPTLLFRSRLQSDEDGAGLHKIIPTTLKELLSRAQMLMPMKKMTSTTLKELLSRAQSASASPPILEEEEEDVCRPMKRRRKRRRRRRGKTMKNPRFVDIFKTKKKFGVIYADPPWNYAISGSKKYQGQAHFHYPTMKFEDIKNLPIQRIKKDTCALLLWTTSSFLPQAFELIKAWGFKYISMFLDWHKINKKTKELVNNGMGHYTIIINEFLLLGMSGEGHRVRRIAPMTIVDDHVIVDDDEYLLFARNGKVKGEYREETYITHRNVIDSEEPIERKDKEAIALQFHSGEVRAPRGRHSAKPDEGFDVIDRIFPQDKEPARLELFSRKVREGWYCWGNDSSIITKKENEDAKGKEKKRRREKKKRRKQDDKKKRKKVKKKREKEDRKRKKERKERKERKKNKK
ncbi:MAG: ribonuclease H1 domain-containing protein [Promethearchaeota archaeon]